MITNQNMESCKLTINGNGNVLVPLSGSFCGFTVVASALDEDSVVTACLNAPGDTVAPLTFTATANADGVCAFTFRLAAPAKLGISLKVSGNASADTILQVSMYENSLYLHRMGSAR